MRHSEHVVKYSVPDILENNIVEKHLFFIIVNKRNINILITNILYNLFQEGKDMKEALYQKLKNF